LTVVFVLLTGVIFRAGTLDTAWHVFQGLVIPPDFSRVRHLLPIFAAVLTALLSPASQDIIALLTRRPRPMLAGLLGIAVLALLIELGDQEVYEFAYFKF
jgi:hypothetical protein